MDCEPLMGMWPDHAPDPVHDVAFAAHQVSVELLPLITELGLALRPMLGAGDITDTVADCAALPPAPMQVNVKVAFAVSEPVDSEPVTAFVPDQAPEAEHAVALLADQVSVEAEPGMTVLGTALSVTIGGNVGTVTVTICVAEPPDPVQVNT